MAFCMSGRASRLSDSELSICRDWYSIARSLSSDSLLRSPLTVKPPPARANREPMQLRSRWRSPETPDTVQRFQCIGGTFFR